VRADPSQHPGHHRRGAPSRISLRDAVGIANGTPEQDTIVLGAGTYEINIPVPPFDLFDFSSSYGDLDITQPVVIRGEGRDLTTIEFQGEYRGFHIQQLVPLELRDLTVLNVNDADATGGINTIFEVIAEGVRFRTTTAAGVAPSPRRQPGSPHHDRRYLRGHFRQLRGAIYGGAGGTFRNVSSQQRKRLPGLMAARSIISDVVIGLRIRWPAPAAAAPLSTPQL
jgi:hypothetical protein